MHGFSAKREEGWQSAIAKKLYIFHRLLWFAEQVCRCMEVEPEQRELEVWLSDDEPHRLQIMKLRTCPPEQFNVDEAVSYFQSEYDRVKALVAECRQDAETQCEAIVRAWLAQLRIECCTPSYRSVQPKALIKSPIDGHPGQLLFHSNDGTFAVCACVSVC